MPKKILFFVTEDWYFCSHRLPLGVAAREAGYDVAVVTRVRAHGAVIEAAGLRLIPIDLERGGKNPLTEWRALWALYQIFRREQPDLVHNVAMKPVLYGTLAARLAGVGRIVNAVAGLGHVFTGTGILRGLVTLALRGLLASRRVAVIVQNPDDQGYMRALGLEDGRLHLIRGSGVDLALFSPQQAAPEPPLVVLPARMLWAKGVGEFVAAARTLRAAGIAARFALVGDPDPENPASVPQAQLDAWQREGVVEWWGRREDMADVLAQAHIVCLPSYYREGLPKALIEAAAAGRPIITTDTPGCREVVRHGENGLLVSVKDDAALVEALRCLILDPELRARMGRCSRERAEAEFGIAQVTAATLAIYAAALSI